MWTVIKDFLFSIIEFFYNIVGDWGLAILMITVIIRLLLFPIAQKQYKSNHEMQKIQPKLKELQDKYGDDKERYNEEMMKFYSENKFNPLAGCLPMILQMPIFLAIFQTLRDPKYIQQGESGLWGFLQDMTVSPWSTFQDQGLVASLPYFLLVLLFAVSTLVPMLLQDNATRQTKMIGGYMSLVMLWFGSVSPAGVLVYWDASTILGVVQQQASKRIYKKKDKEEEDAMIDVKPVEVDVTRKEKKVRPKKKSK